MYENEIEDFEEQLRDSEPDGHIATDETVRFVIALMRAAQPEDAYAERVHCERLVQMTNWAVPARERAAILLRERAAARAERAAEIERLKAEYDNDHQMLVGVVHKLEAELAALKAAGAPKDEAAEREHCRAAVMSTNGDWGHLDEHTDLLFRERAAVRAECRVEIERLKAALAAAQGDLEDPSYYWGVKKEQGE